MVPLVRWWCVAVRTAASHSLHERLDTDPTDSAKNVEKHALGITKGKTYAELDQEDPIRAVAAESSFVRASLLTAVTAFGLSALVAGLGVVLLFVAFALGSLTRAFAPEKEKATDETDGLSPSTAMSILPS